MNRMKVLIVDDYIENINALTELLRSDDIEILTATGGEEALNIFSQIEIDLALFDVQMPGMTGFELARLVRGVRRYRHLPIIFVTAQQQDRSVIFEGYETGAVDLLFKPLDPHVVRSKVRAFVEIIQQRGILKDHVDELERLKLQAEAANLAKSQFLANMSHEIRTPLASVMGFAELLAQNEISQDERARSMDAVKRNGHLLMRLIDDILDLSKIEAGRIEFENVSFNLDELIKDVETTLSFRAKDKGICLTFHRPQEGIKDYVSDPIRIKQIFLNVIGNAIKFTQKGQVSVNLEISSTQAGLSPEADTIKLTVKDQGIGMTPEQSKRLFQPFGQADVSTRRHFGGSGLGLVISREISRALGGDIKLLESAPEKGSVFQVSMSLEKAKQEASSPSKPTTAASANLRTDLSDKKILVVDDSPDNLTLIELFLQDTKAKMTFANNGFEAIDCIRNQAFDMILMDIQMPGKDGHETTEEIRQMGYKKPIIALTAHAIKAEHAKCLSSGCNAVMVKPIDRRKLVELIKANI